MDNGTQVKAMERFDKGVEARIERVFDRNQETIWQMLTEANNLAQWLAPGSIEPHVGGRVHIDFGDSGQTIESSLRQFDPPRLLEYSWSNSSDIERPLRWELTEAGNSTRLSLTIRLPAGEDIAKACAGFDAHFEMLAAALEGIPIRFPVDYFIKVRHTYEDAVSKLE